jgi:hypothetical protein
LLQRRFRRRTRDRHRAFSRLSQWP